MTEELLGMRVVTEPLLPHGYVAIVADDGSAVIVYPDGTILEVPSPFKEVRWTIQNRKDS